MPTEAIRRIIHVFSAEGENRVVQAHNKVASATETTGKATLSLDKQFSGLERRYNTMVRAQQDYERVQRQVNAAVAANPALHERANTVLGLAAQKYNTLVAANDNFAAAQKRASAAVAGFVASVQGLALGGAIGALAGLAGGLLSGREFITNTIEADNALQRLRAVLDATGNAAGITEKEVLDLSAGIQQTTRYGDEAVTTVTALLLSLSDIGKDTVPRAVRAITDMATVLDVDLNSAAVTLSKALEGNVTALQRYGVTINKDVIDNLKAAGRETEAYDLVLSRLEDRFGGAADKARQSLGGALDALKNAFGDLFELGSQGQPLIESIERLTQLLGQDDIKNGVLAIGKAFVDAFTQAITLTQSLVGAMNDLANFNFSGLAERVRGLFDFNVSLTGGGLLGAITGGSKGTVLGSSPGLPQGFPGVTGDLPQPFNTEFMNSIKEVNDRMLEYGVIAGKARKITDAVAESAGKSGKKFQDKAKSVDVVIEALQKLSNTAADFISSFVQGIIDGKNAVESLGQSLKNAGSSLLSSGLKDFLSGEGGLLKGLTGAGGLLGSLTGSLSSVLGIGAGAATGGITALLGAGVGLIGNLFGGKKQSEQQALQAAKDLAEAQQKWRDMASDFSSWIHDWTTGVSGELHNAIESARSQMQSFANAASAAHDPGGVASAQAAFNTGVTRSINEALDALLNLGVETSSYSQKLKEARDKAEDIRLTLIEFGTTAEEAALAVETRLNVAVSRLRDQFLDDLVRKVNDLAGGAWINQLTDLVDEVAQLRTDAAALGIQTGLIDEYFVRAAQKIIDENQLVGSAFDAVAATLGPLGAGLHEFSAAAEEAAQALKRSAQEIANTIQSYQDQLFIAQQDTQTLAGQLAVFDLQAQRAREQEIAAGGEALAALEALQAQQRLNIINDYNRRIAEEQQRALEQQLEAQRRAAEEAQRVWDEAAKFLQNATQNIQNWISSFLGGSQSPLSPLARLSSAQSTFSTQYSAALGGNRDALQGITGNAQTLIEAIKSVYGSTSAGQTLINQAISQLQSLPSQLSPEQFIVDNLTPAINDVTAGVDAQTSAMQTLFANLQAAVNSGNASAIAAALLPVFNSIDTNTDNALTFAEMQSALGATYSTGTLRSIFTELDGNGNGILEKSELIKTATQTTGTNTGSTSTNTANMPQMANNISTINGYSLTTSNNTGNIITAMGGFSGSNYLATSVNSLSAILSALGSTGVIPQKLGDAGIGNSLIGESERIRSNLYEQNLNWGDGWAPSGATYVAAGAQIQPYATGGYVYGPSHANGGRIIEVEGGEYIVNKRDTTRFRSQLDGMNYRHQSPANDNGDMRELIARIDRLERRLVAATIGGAQMVSDRVGDVADEQSELNKRLGRSQARRSV